MADSWLVVSDETGQFDSVGSSHRPLGVGLVMARLADWQAALEEDLDGQSVARLCAKPIPGLDQHSKYHHVRDFLLFANSQPKHQNPWKKKAGNPTLVAAAAHLDRLFRWLLHHPRLITLGLIGPAGAIKRALASQQEDPAVLIGKLTARPLMLIWPFLNNDDRLLIAPGQRSEKAGSKAMVRVGRTFMKAINYQDRDRGLAGPRTMVSTLLGEVRSTASNFPHLDPQRCDAGTLAYLENECTQLRAVQLDRLALIAIADLAASLALLTSGFADHNLHYPSSPWPNARFYRIEEVSPV